MPYAVVFYLDPEKNRPIRKIIHELAQKNIAPYMQAMSMQPHVTLAIYDDLECRTCESKISGLARKIHGFNLTFSFLGIFQSENPVVFLGPTITQELLSIHFRLHELLKDAAMHPWDLYRPGKWVPHCSLAVEFPAEKLPNAVQICRKLTLPLTIPVASLGVVQFEPVKPLYDYAFTGVEPAA